MYSWGLADTDTASLLRPLVSHSSSGFEHSRHEARHEGCFSGSCFSPTCHDFEKGIANQQTSISKKCSTKYPSFFWKNKTNRWHVQTGKCIFMLSLQLVSPAYLTQHTTTRHKLSLIDSCLLISWKSWWISWSSQPRLKSCMTWGRLTHWSYQVSPKAPQPRRQVPTAAQWFHPLATKDLPWDPLPLNDHFQLCQDDGIVPWKTQQLGCQKTAWQQILSRPRLELFMHHVIRSLPGTRSFASKNLRLSKRIWTHKPCQFRVSAGFLLFLVTHYI